MNDYGDFKEGWSVSYDDYRDLRQEYEDLKNDRSYIKSLLDSEFEKNIDLKRENEQLNSKNNRLKIRNRELRAELKIRKADVDYADKINNELFDECKQYKKENEKLKQRCKELRNDLIDHSALINMLEDVKSLRIEDMIWNTMGYKTQTEFDDDFADYREDAKKRWRE